MEKEKKKLPWNSSNSNFQFPVDFINDLTYPADIAMLPTRPIQLRVVRTLTAYEMLTKVISIVSAMTRTRWRDFDHLVPMLRRGRRLRMIFMIIWIRQMDKNEKTSINANYVTAEFETEKKNYLILTCHSFCVSIFFCFFSERKDCWGTSKLSVEGKLNKNTHIAHWESIQSLNKVYWDDVQYIYTIPSRPFVLLWSLTIHHHFVASDDNRRWNETR